MPYRLTGAGGFGFSVNWEKVPGDKRVAEQVIGYLEDRRVLFRKRSGEDGMYCVMSANDVRHFLTGQLAEAKPGKSLATSIRAMRAAFREFVDAAGLDAENFRSNRSGMPTNEFSLALGELRSRVGLQVALIADRYEIDVEEELAEILPPPLDDPSFLPGFGELE